MSPWQSSPLRAQRSGFTLIELLVVVLIIGILAAIALPRLLGGRTRAKNAAAQAAVRHALLAARSYYTQQGESYAGLDAGKLQAYESSLSGSEAADGQTPGSSANPQNIWIGNGYDGTNPATGDLYGGRTVTLCSVSRGDSTYCVRDQNGATSYSTSTVGGPLSTGSAVFLPGGWNSGASAINQIVGGNEYGCVLLGDGSAKCWGRNQAGQVGDGSTTQRNSPVAVSGLSGAAQLTGRGGQTCALRPSGSVQCWGGNGAGQLGDTTNTNSYTPTTSVSGITNATQISGGSSHVCAVLSGGSLRCWGANGGGQVGDGSTIDRNAPVAVTGVSGSVVQVAGSSYAHTCAVISGGSVQCWGLNNYGQVGDGSTINRSSPTTVPGISGAVQVSAGEYHSCALLGDGTVKCWGYNSYGQLGDGSTTNSSSPVTSQGVSGATALSSGGYTNCVIVGGGAVQCWGKGNAGELGNGASNNSSTPVAVSGISGAGQVVTGWYHSCVLLTGGTVKCWGHNGYGQLGDGSTSSHNSPAPIA